MWDCRPAEGCYHTRTTTEQGRRGDGRRVQGGGRLRDAAAAKPVTNLRESNSPAPAEQETRRSSGDPRGQVPRKDGREERPYRSRRIRRRGETGERGGEGRGAQPRPRRKGR